MTSKIQPTQRKKSSNKGIIIGLGILALSLASFSGYLYNKILSYETIIEISDNNVKEKDGQINDLIFEMESNILVYELLGSNYEELGIANDSIQLMVQNLQEEVKSWKSRKWNSDAELKKAKMEMETRLAELHLDLDTKTKEVEQLQLANEVLASSVDSLIEVNGQHSENIEGLSEKIEIASILKTEDLKISVVSPKDKEIVKEQYKAKSIQKIKVHFNLAENKIAAHDKKAMVLQIIEPSGSVLFDLEHGGGSFSKSDGHNDFYTQKQTIDFTNTQQEVDFLYEKGDLLAAGTYKVIINSDSHEIGASTFVVR